MHAIRQSCRPKHQVLVLKCYPKFQKNSNVEAKPNSSELSYLLFYASTRRSKLQKVADFLDKRNNTDVYRARIGNIQVTLQILKALIEKCPRDLPLYGWAILRIFRTILSSNDITIVEDSVPVFQTFCSHQDPAFLAADQDFKDQFEKIVDLYATFASKDDPGPTKSLSVPIAIRFRKAGLDAVKSVASSDALSLETERQRSETGRQLRVIVSIILQNLYSDTGSYLTLLERREKEKEEIEKESAQRRRQSISTVRTADTSDGDLLAASGTAEDADKLAEEAVGIDALQALRYIFTANNRTQLRLATSAVLKFIAARIEPEEQVRRESWTSTSGTWATTLFKLICGWAPVQDRFVILVTAMETLIRSPIVEADLERQLVLASIVGWLLSSPINFVGLSVMDVLIGFISHILLLLQLGGEGTTLFPHHQQTDVVGTNQTLKGADISPLPAGNLTSTVVMEVVKSPSKTRIRLLDQLQTCIGALATHIYYTDQVSDMITAILSRLKPSPASGISSTAAIEDPVGATRSITGSVNLQERPNTDGFFSFDEARVRALLAVKDILLVVNSQTKSKGSTNASRGRIGVEVWEQTQWLLRDPYWDVRKAYVDMLLTWLDLEVGKGELRVTDGRKKSKLPEKKENDLHRGNSLARRAVSNASQRDTSPIRGKSMFLKLLHLAVYDNALQYSGSESDILLLHLLLSGLVSNLGVNSVRSGLPMIMRLQEDIQVVVNPSAKVLIGSLVHGYLWSLSDTFEFETTSVGRTIHGEISRRSSKHLWLRKIQVPPLPLDAIEPPPTGPLAPKLSSELVQSESLKPFDARQALVDCISKGYTSSLQSPPSSPPSSPSRTHSIPILTRTLTPSTSNTQLPQKIQEELLSDWDKEACIAETAKNSPRSSSLTGSRTTGTGPGYRNLLGVSVPTGHISPFDVSSSPVHTQHPQSRPPSHAYGLVGNRGDVPRSRHASQSPTPLSTSSARSTVRVEDLKRVLSTSERHGLPSRGRQSLDPRREIEEDTSSESEVSADFSMSEISSVTGSGIQTIPEQEHGDRGLAITTPNTGREREGSVTPRPIPGAFPRGLSEATVRSEDSVPPVPPLPASLRGSVSSPIPSSPPGPLAITTDEKGGRAGNH
ncbi:hypothetical protein M501DRAFT_1009019 [Patellaria atrata CBS 101060]|uniref:Protein EFR3 n=1 Tax=Patellaria atrata CBS 101060 TaxID=1346257 RepID=A0A9P4S219_9PEZI|nr:hypothetical protein M501DRAFT_1009019 [Patellaria atrata CBS 101060]